MINAIVERLALSAVAIRKLMGQYLDVAEFLEDTYGDVVIRPEIKGSNPWHTNYPECGLCLHYAAKVRRVPIITDEGRRTFTDVMAVVTGKDYKNRDSTMAEDVVSMAEQKRVLLMDFYGRNAILDLSKIKRF